MEVARCYKLFTLLTMLQPLTLLSLFVDTVHTALEKKAILFIHIIRIYNCRQDKS